MLFLILLVPVVIPLLFSLVKSVSNDVVIGVHVICALLCYLLLYKDFEGNSLFWLFSSSSHSQPSSDSEEYLMDENGHRMDGHFGSNGDFYGKDGNTYKKNAGDDSWPREELTIKSIYK